MILIHQRHRQTDRRTTCNLNTALCTSASRGKNYMKSICCCYIGIRQSALGTLSFHIYAFLSLCKTAETGCRLNLTYLSLWFNTNTSKTRTPCSLVSTVVARYSLVSTFNGVVHRIPRMHSGGLEADLLPHGGSIMALLPPAAHLAAGLP